MTEVDRLNAEFGIGRELQFREDGSGLVLVDVENPLASATLCLQGAQLLSWRPRTTSLPVVWLSPAAVLARGKSPHSGAPVCWPWFGAHAEHADWPAHGFARVAEWEVTEAAAQPDGSTALALQMVMSPDMAPHWPHASRLVLRLVIGETLQLALETSNLGAAPLVLTEALHTYFQVGDVNRIEVHGLAGAIYADKVEGFARKVQQGAITFAGETDRVYLDSEAECVIDDPELRRRIHIAKSGSRSTVVWNPGAANAARLADVDGHWRHMVCVESANALDNRLTVGPGETHTLAVSYRVVPA